MTNYEKYNKLHAEVMKRLEDGEITIETAKEVNDLAFEKYVTENAFVIVTDVAAGGALGGLAGAGFALLSMVLLYTIQNKLALNRRVKLKGKAHETYKKLLAKYLDEKYNNEIKPNAIEFKRFTFEIFTSAPNKTQLCNAYGKKDDDDETVFNKIKKNFDNCIVYKKEILGICTDEKYQQVNSKYRINYPSGWILAYHTGIIDKKFGLTDILKFYKDTDPDAYEKAQEVLKEMKNKENKYK